jgi:outer membrane beta-barrel protein
MLAKNLILKELSLTCLVFLLLCSPAFADETSESESLETQLENLNTPINQAPGVLQEKFYSIQDRYSPLKGRVETTATLSEKMSDVGFIQSREFGAGIRYYFNSKWSLGVNGSAAMNKLSNSAERLFVKDGLVPDVPYTKYRGDLSTRYNLFYGKFRLSMDRVLYFDQYVSLGPAYIVTSNGNAIGAAADIGFAFWIGRNWSAHFGIKDYVYGEPNSTGNSLVNQLFVTLNIGYIFGSGV